MLRTIANRNIVIEVHLVTCYQEITNFLLVGRNEKGGILPKSGIFTILKISTPLRVSFALSRPQLASVINPRGPQVQLVGRKGRGINLRNGPRKT